MKGKGQFHTSLVGRYVKPTDLLKRVDEGRTEKMWRLQPNKTGDLFALIVGAWVEDNTVQLQIVGPTGDTQRFFMGEGLVTVHETAAECWMK